jgi:hypothetical protein
MNRSIAPIPDRPNALRLDWYGPGRELPPYRYVPGLHPHPINHPRGHSFRLAARPHPPWKPDEWPRLAPYLRGVDLFNRFYFWEAHEAWETLWKSEPQTTRARDFVQGLIQVSAALLKLHMGQPRSVERLWRDAAAHLAPLRDRVWMGLPVERLAKDMDSYLAPVSQGDLPALGGDTPTIRLVPPEAR